MNRTLAALPVDARPVVRSQVRDMVACAGWDLRVPPVNMLGHLRSPGDRDALQDWLLDQATQVDGFVISLDMLVYGGLVPSRFIPDSAETLLERLEFLRRLRLHGPSKPIHAFAATMRISNNNVAEEEKAYWAQYGAQLWAWSFHQDRALHAHSPDDAVASLQLVRSLEREIPSAIRADYLMTRQRNLNVTLQALQLVKSGVISRLVLPQDDTAEFGLNVAERRHLQVQTDLLKIGSRVAVYAGADEVMHTLCARMVSELEQRTPLSVHVWPSDPARVQTLRARYEDRPLAHSLSSQLAAVGAQPVDTATQADVVLALHSQGLEQGDWAMNIELPERTEVSPSWSAALHQAREQGRTVALADVAYANGGDPWLLTQALPKWDAYAGWNTASNTLGCVLAQCVLGHGRFQEEPAQRALSLRLLEDLLYQAQLRQRLRARIDETRCGPGELLEQARALVVPAARVFAQTHGLSHRVADVRMPWNRSFEIDLQLEPCE